MLHLRFAGCDAQALAIAIAIAAISELKTHSFCGSSCDLALAMPNLGKV